LLQQDSPAERKLQYGSYDDYGSYDESDNYADYGSYDDYDDYGGCVLTIYDEDCMEYTSHIEGITECTYTAEYDICTYEEIYCEATAVINGETITDTCEAMENGFEDSTGGNEGGDDDCIETVEEDCMDMF